MLQTVDKAPSCEGAFLVPWLQKVCTCKHIKSSESAIFAGLFTVFLVEWKSKNKCGVSCDDTEYR